MSTRTRTRTRLRPDTGRSDAVRPFVLGARGFVALGTGHLVLAAMLETLGTKTPQQRAADEAMRESALTLLGIERTTLDVFQGISIVMSLFTIACGLLLLAAVRHAPTLVERRSAFGRITLATSLATLAASIWLLPPPPIAVLAFTSCAFALSLRRATTSSQIM
ncbi:LIC_13387 family protein [Streptomyces sp. NPDC054956]